MVEIFGGKTRVLVVDDQAVLAEGLAALLTSAGMVARIATGPQLHEAPSVAARWRPHVALVGLSLPGGASFQLARQIAARSPNVKTVFLDDRVHWGHVRTTIRWGAAGYWVKQAPFAELAQGLRRAAEGQPSFCPAVQRHLVRTSSGLRFQPPPEASPLSRLTARELDVLELLAAGLSVHRCAQRLRLSPFTIDNHKARLLRKLGVHKTSQLVLLAIREGLTRD